MSRHISNLLVGLRGRSLSREPARYAHEGTEAPRSTRKIQEMLDWKTLERHFAQSADADTSFQAEPTSPGNSEVNQPHLICPSTRQLEQELLARAFQEAHAGVARKALELKDAVLQVSASEDDTQQHEMQELYSQMMRNSTELFSALSHKMSRLQARIDLSSERAQQPKATMACNMSPALSRKESDDTHHQSVLEPQPPERNRSYNSYVRRGVSMQRSGGKSKVSASRRPSRSQQQAVGEQAIKVKAPVESHAKTEGALPQPRFDDALRLHQPSTLPNLPHIDMNETSSPLHSSSF